MDRSDIFNLQTQTTQVSKQPTISEMFRTIIVEAGEAAKNLVYQKTNAEIARLQRRQAEAGLPSATNEAAPPKALNLFGQSNPMMIFIIILVMVMILK